MLFINFMLIFFMGNCVDVLNDIDGKINVFEFFNVY